MLENVFEGKVHAQFHPLFGCHLQGSRESSDALHTPLADREAHASESLFARGLSMPSKIVSKL